MPDWLMVVPLLAIGLIVGIFIGSTLEINQAQREAVGHGCATFLVGENGATEFRWKAK